jgi:tRNA-splicing ligase RtcB
VVKQKDFDRIDDYVWELPAGYDDEMQSPVRIFANKEIFSQAFGDRSVEQLINVSKLPGIVNYAMAMPDMHQGYGFPIGGVAAFDYDEGIVSPGGVGYDINCGVRLLTSGLHIEQIQSHLDDLATRLYNNCPSGVGRDGAVSLSHSEIEQVLEQGAEWAKSQGYANERDLTCTESGGRLPGARASAVPDRAKERGRPQLGSLGSGNHFLEVDVIDEVFDPELADSLGLVEGNVAVQIHCGSRGLGHEVCKQYLKRLQGVPQKYGIPIPDRELVSAPLDSEEGSDYMAAMAGAANYAFANRQVLAHWVRRSFEQVLAGHVSDWTLRQVYDVTHNVAKIEEHVVGGERRRLVVHRKGATRAYPPDHPDLPDVYQQSGQPVLVPGSMGTPSYVLVGREEGMEQAFGSSCHGAGRTMSRRAATRKERGESVRSRLGDQGIAIRARSMRGLAEEAPYAYKDVSLVVDSVVGAGLAKKVARLEPVAVIKG